MVLLKKGRLNGMISNKFKVVRQFWNLCLRKTGSRILYSPEIPIRMLTSLLHNWDWRHLQNWAEVGVTRMGDLYRDGVLLPFEELSQEFELPLGDFLLHGAVTAAIRKHWKRGLEEPPVHCSSQYVATTEGRVKAATCLYRSIRYDVL